jgi:hypothetical protein
MLPMSAPKSKLPYIEDGVQILGDSGFIALFLGPHFYLQRRFRRFRYLASKSSMQADMRSDRGNS